MTKISEVAATSGRPAMPTGRKGYVKSAALFLQQQLGDLNCIERGTLEELVARNE